MLGILFFFLCIGAGMAGLWLLPVRLTKSEHVAIGGVLGLLGGSWLSLLGVAVLGYESGLIGSSLLMLGVVVHGLRRQYRSLQHMEEARVRGWKYWVCWGFLLSLGSLLIYLVLTHFLPEESGVWYSAGYTWGDIAVHMSLASHFAEQPNFKLDFSLFPPSLLSYPFLADFFTGILVRLGASWQVAFVLPTVMMFYAFVRLMLSMATRLIGSFRAGLVHLGIVLFSGSAMGLWYFWKDFQVSGWDVVVQQDYTSIPAQHLHFINLLTSHLLPQRSYLFGICIFLSLVVLLIQQVEHRRAQVIYVVAAALGLLPFVHVHTFFVLTAVLVLYCMFTKGFGWREWGGPMVVAIVLAAPQLWWQFTFGYQADFTAFRIGWMTPPNTNVALFWLRNLGVALPLFLLIPWILKRYPHPFLRILAIVGVGIGIAGNVHIFQPNEWDNMKFFTYAYILLTLPLAAFLADLTRRTLTGIPAFFFIFFLTAPGVLAVCRETTLRYQLIGTDERQVAAYILDYTDPQDVILTTSRHDHPVPLLTGRPIVLGYTGWLWSYGIDYHEREQEVSTMFAGTRETPDLLRKYNVRYVVISEREMGQVGFSESYYRLHLQLLTTIGQWQVYQVPMDRWH